MNPLGNIPVFLSTLKSIDPKRHNKIIIRESFIAFIALAIFAFFGQYILRGMQISEQALGISGGIILFLISIRMIFPENKGGAEKPMVGEPFIVPLAIPLTAGPAAMTTAMLFAARGPVHIFSMLVVLLATASSVCLVLLSSRYISSVLGERGLIALERLAGMMLTAMSIQMLLTGIENYFRLH